MTVSQTQNNAAETTLVIGGTGKTGRRVAQRLAAKGVNVRIGSRSQTPAFDWENQSTWRAALEGVNKVYITFFPDLAVPSAPPAITAFCALAKELQVQHLVLLSGRGEPAAQQCEQIVQASGITWTVLRASWFSQNFSEGFMYDAVLHGTVALPVQNIAEPFIDIEDIAEVAAEALTSDKHNNKLYEMTGPELLTFDEAVKDIAHYTGRSVEFMQIPMETFNAQMRELQVPDDAVRLLNYLFTNVLDGRNAHTTNGVEEALGRPAGSFRDYVRRTAIEGVWKSQTTAPVL